MENKPLLDMWISSHIPAKLSVMRLCSLKPPQSLEYLLVWVLEGQVDAVINREKRSLGSNVLLIINPLDSHHLSGDGNNTVMMLSLGRTPPSSDAGRVVLEAGSEDSGHGEQIRIILANILSTVLSKTMNWKILLESYVPGLWYELLTGFAVHQDVAHHAQSSAGRIDAVRQYILQNYTQTITLEDAARTAFLSTAYLSRLFKQTCGISFYSYLTRVRLNRAVELLLNTEESINRIALQCGFPSDRSFRQAFAAAYGQTPGELREMTKRKTAPGGATLADVMVFDRTLIEEYKNRAYQLEVCPFRLTLPLTVNMTELGTPFRHTWKTLMGFGYAYELLNQNLQEQVAAFAECGGFTHLMLTGFFHEDILLYKEDGQGLSCNFRYLDDIIDFTCSIGLRPFINLSYTPQALASTSNTLVRKRRKHFTSPPNDIAKWGALVESFVRHMINRYGRDEVRLWYFETWATPEIQVFWDGTMEEYHLLYLATYRAIRQHLPDAKIGGAGFITSNIMGNSILEDYVRFCVDNSAAPNFLSLHIYPISFGGSGEAEQNKVTAFNLEYSQQFSQYESLQQSFERHNISLAENYMPSVLDDINSRIAPLLPGVEIVATEWNSSPAPFHSQRDTCFQSAYIAKTVNETFDKLAGLNYWFCSDIYEGYRSGISLFHGGRGVFCSNGLKKASFHVYALLAGLGDSLLHRGDGYLVTKKNNNSLQVLLYNYINYESDSFGDNKEEPRNHTEERQLCFKLDILGGTAQSYRMHSKILNSEHGNLLGLWMEMGAPDTLTAEEFRYLDRKAVPLEAIWIQQKETLYIEAVLAPQEVRFIEITPIE